MQQPDRPSPKGTLTCQGTPSLARHKYRLQVALAGLLWVGGATCPTARDVRADGLLALHKAGDVSAPTYVNGIISGFDHANARLIAEGQRPLYCRRPDQILSANEVLDATGKAVGQVPQKGKLTATLVILHVLIEAFPCPRSPTAEVRQADPQVTSHEHGPGDSSVLPQEAPRQSDAPFAEPGQPPKP